jgi:hypothetical protein
MNIDLNGSEVEYQMILEQKLKESKQRAKRFDTDLNQPHIGVKEREKYIEEYITFGWQELPEDHPLRIQITNQQKITWSKQLKD